MVENPGITEFFSEDTGLSPELLHYCPHGATVVVGGTAEVDVWSREPDPDLAAAIIDRCAKVEPRRATRGFLGIASACAQPVRWCVLKR